MTALPADDGVALAAALDYARRGWRVVPIIRGQKRPPFDAWQDKATTDETTIRRWFKGAAHGVGIATGAASGIFVLDVDVRPGKDGNETLADLEAEFGALPATREHLTGSGGRHLFFRVPPGATIRNDVGKRLGFGLDVRGEGGQVLAPPTIHPNGQPYHVELGSPDEPADPPGWLVRLLTDDTRAEPRAERVPYQGDPRPGDRFAAAHTWPELLTADGATFLAARRDTAGNTYELWARPGVDDHPGATLYYGGTDLLKVFTSNWPGLDEGATYTRFGYYAATQHAGDHAAAARTLGERLDTIAWAEAAGGAERPPGEPTGADPGGRPVVFVGGRTLDTITGEVVANLAAANDPPALFVRAGNVTRVRADETGRPLVEPLDAEHLRWHATAAMDFARRLNDGPKACIAPLDIFRSITKAPAWPFPGLVGITETPILRPDGSIRTDHGWDDATGLYHWSHGTYPPIPEQPTAEQLADAVDLVAEMLCDFPFDTSADRANAWALLLTGLVRPLVAGQAPLAVLDAPEPGTGKSLLAEVVALVTTGRTTAIQPMPDDGEELEKRITGLLVGGSTVIIFDNVESTIRSAVLAAALTADTWQGRILGRTGQVEVPNRATWMITGNNIDVGGDLARRCYRIRLDARQARPWERDGFRHPDLKGWVAANRPRIVAALATIVRSWWAAGRPQGPGVSAMGGYTPWVRIVGGILHHAGVEDFLGNLAAFHADADTDAQAAEAFLTAWRTQLGDRLVTVAELVRWMDGAADSPLRAALPDDLVGWWGAPSFAKRMGRWLLKRAGRHYGSDGVHVVRAGVDRNKVVLWSVHLRGVTPQGVFELPGQSVACGVAGLALPPHVETESYRGGAYIENGGNEPREPLQPRDEPPGRLW